MNDLNHCKNKKKKVLVLADNKNYQKTQSRSSSKTSNKTVTIHQTIHRLVLNPFDTTGNIHQEIYIAAGNK